VDEAVRRRQDERARWVCRKVSIPFAIQKRLDHKYSYGRGSIAGRFSSRSRQDDGGPFLSTEKELAALDVR